MPPQAKSDPWEEAAKQYTAGGAKPATADAPAASGDDDWKIWQQNSPAAPEEKDTRNGLQKAFDDETKLEPFNERPGVLGHVLTGIGNIGAGFMQTATPLVHPLQTGKSVLNTVAGGMGVPEPFEDTPDIPHALLESAIENPSGTAESLVGNAAGAHVVGAIAKPVGARIGAGLRTAAPRIANVALGTVPDAYGGNPGLAAAREGISAFSPQGVLAKTKALIPEAAEEHRAVLSKFPERRVDIGEDVASPFKSIREQKTDPLTGAATVPQISKLNRMQTSLLHEPDPLTGQPTTALRPLNQYSPSQANELKSNIYGMTDYDSPFKSSLANDALKQSAHGIKEQITKAVPESEESGDRLHQLMALKDLMERRGMTGMPVSKNAIRTNLIRKAGTSAAGSLFHLGETLPESVNIFPALAAVGAQSRKK